MCQPLRLALCKLLRFGCCFAIRAGKRCSRIGAHFALVSSVLFALVIARHYSGISGFGLAAAIPLIY